MLNGLEIYSHMPESSLFVFTNLRAFVDAVSTFQVRWPCISLSHQVQHFLSITTLHILKMMLPQLYIDEPRKTFRSVWIRTMTQTSEMTLWMMMLFATAEHHCHMGQWEIAAMLPSLFNATCRTNQWILRSARGMTLFRNACWLSEEQIELRS